jgi:hypothetical protein
VLTLHALGFLIYLLGFFYLGWNSALARSWLFVLMALVMLYLVIDEWNGKGPKTELRFNTLNKMFFVLNFVTFFIILQGWFDTSVDYMILYTIGVVITSIFILCSGLRNKLFKNE